MKYFFDALSEFLGSDLAKSHGWVILVSFIICVVLVGVIMWLIFTKIIVPAKIIEYSKMGQENRDLIEKINSLESQNLLFQEENMRLQQKLERYKFQEAMEDSGSNSFEDRALEKFIH